jgi:tRNA 2-thiouridine synthesizing protein E
MPEIEFQGAKFTVSEDGFLDHLESWCPEWVQWVQKEEGIDELTDDHWKVIHVIQDYYRKNGIAPMVRILCKVTGFTQNDLYRLFPTGPSKGACKMAGLPRPTGCCI